ncbi:hypothetical protein B0O80DRAFT_425769 [Mortierella sp. GBAus27b]|nr:hypothetical protein BGX31_002027 [Mortierella sp. GBA43]KAI8355253.1 hypothetical protein B0O80DRAFT_425769 [Mortierella sp. GBAus27b]
MVTISLACVATDGVSLYGLSVNAAPYSTSNYHYVLVKSNPNPSPTLTGLSWTLIDSKPMDSSVYALAISSVNDFNCAVNNSTKVFTALSRRSKKTNDDLTDNQTRGIRYTPANGGGAGTWTNIDASPSYRWDDDSYSTQLYEFNDPTTGSTTLMHASIQKSYPKVYVAAMDLATSTMKQNPTSWDFTSYGELVGIALANSHLYTLGATDNSDTLAVVPIQSGSTAAPSPTIKSYNATIIGNACDRQHYYAYMAALENKLVMWCTPMSDRTTKVFVFDGTNLTALPPSSGTTSPQSAVAMPGSVPFLFMSDDNGLYSIPLSGGNAGVWSRANPVNVTDSIFGDSDSTSGESDYRKQSILIGVLSGVAVLIVLLFGIWYWRYIKKRRQPTTVYSTENTEMTAGAGAESRTGTTTELLVMESGKEEFTTIDLPVSEMKVEDPTLDYYPPPSPGGASHTTAFITPLQTQELMLSDHPRPNVIISGAVGGSSSSQTPGRPRGPQTEYHDGERSVDVIMEEMGIDPARTGPSAPQFRG